MSPSPSATVTSARSPSVRQSPGLPRDFEQRFGVAYANELEHFARCVRDGLAPEPSAADALAAFDLARAAEQSWRAGHTIAVHAERTDDGVRYTVKQETQ